MTAPAESAAAAADLVENFAASNVWVDRRRWTVGMIGAGHVWLIASARVDGIAAGPEKNSPLMHEAIDRRVRAFLQGLARGQTAVQGGRPDSSPNLL